MDKIDDFFKQHWIDFEMKNSGCSYMEAEHKFNDWKKNNKKKYKECFDEFFDEIHPY